MKKRVRVVDFVVNGIKSIRFLVLFLTLRVVAQVSTATVVGTVQDSTTAAIPDAQIKLINDQTGTENDSKTGGDGRFVLTGILPGVYRLWIQRNGFATTQLSGITLNIGDTRNFLVRLKIGPVTESVTVDASGITPNTNDASVTTVVDRRFVSTIPLNGQSFQDLISMTPGIVTQNPQAAGQGSGEPGDFSVNGQSPGANSFYIDGVSANLSLGSGQKGSAIFSTGSSAGSTALGTTQSLVSVDALQELRVLTANYSAEYGRTPGGQFTFLTRSGTEHFHGTFFGTWRGYQIDASDRFKGYPGQYINHNFFQDDFSGTVSGPARLPKTSFGLDKTFFFLSYEQLNLSQLPPATLFFVPSYSVRAQAPSASYLVFFASPFTTSELSAANGLPSGLSPASSEYDPLPAHLNASSLRIDHIFTPKLSTFARLGDTPSNSNEYTEMLERITNRIRTQTLTFGLNYQASSKINSELRFGIARNKISTESIAQSSRQRLLIFNQTLGLSSGCPLMTGSVDVDVVGVGDSRVSSDCNSSSIEQWNTRDTLSIQAGQHLLKFGFDQRHLASRFTPSALSVRAYLFDRQSMVDGLASEVAISRNEPAHPVLNQFSLFVQDEWKATHSLTVSLGLRSEANFAPHGADGADAYTAFGDVTHPATLWVAPRGTPLWKGSWFNLAPRLGVAWLLDSHPERELVLRVGSGVFFDTGVQPALRAYTEAGFHTTTTLQNAALPLTPEHLATDTSFEPPFRGSTTFAFPRHLQLPYSLQWDIALEKALGRNQTLTLSYIGSHGARLLEEQRRYITPINPQFGNISFFPNGITSNYQSLQTKFQRSIAQGVQALVSYTWAHSLAYGSTDPAFSLVYGNSDYDVRHNVEGAISWDLPRPKREIPRYVMGGWSLEGRLIARTGFPVTLLGNRLLDPITGERYYSGVDLIPHTPLYIDAPQYPGGRVFNGGQNATNPAFVLPGENSAGDAPRNIVRGFDALQTNFGVRKEISMNEKITFQLKGEVFNILNHPNYGYIDPTVTDLLFGQSTRMLNQSFGGTGALYQQGGPRSVQLGFRAVF
ncbi:TonB-dependent receptor [Edaphobacter aggregans]|uniref:TonB-dependent receptor n=1 Tax=Edaphobacter aggregans TaxID=570835 RepID=UPI00068A97CF|nr:carboxypeptidase regulatory-like domain-containing protein [Edaphobacter aggregans]